MALLVPKVVTAATVVWPVLVPRLGVPVLVVLVVTVARAAMVLPVRMR